MTYIRLSILAVCLFVVGLYAPSPSTAALLTSSYGTDSLLAYDSVSGTYLGEFITAGAGGLDQPQGFAFGSDGKLYVNSFATGQIKQYDGTTGSYLGNFASTASPRGMAFDGGGTLYTASGNSVVRFDSTGTVDESFTHTFTQSARGVTFGPDGNLYVAWGSNTENGVARYDVAAGTWNNTHVTGFTAQPWYLTFGSNGNLYIGVSGGTSQIFRFDGSSLAAFTEATSALDRPRGLAFGPDGNLYVGGFGGLSSTNVLRFNGTTGAYEGPFTTGGGLNQPFYLAFADITPVPLPAAVWLFGSGVVGIAAWARRRSHTT